MYIGTKMQFPPLLCEDHLDFKKKKKKKKKIEKSACLKIIRVQYKAISR